MHARQHKGGTRAMPHAAVAGQGRQRWVSRVVVAGRRRWWWVVEGGGRLLRAAVGQGRWQQVKGDGGGSREMATGG